MELEASPESNRILEVGTAQWGQFDLRAQLKSPRKELIGAVSVLSKQLSPQRAPTGSGYSPR
jgi:hypothetical protein